MTKPTFPKCIVLNEEEERATAELKKKGIGNKKIFLTGLEALKLIVKKGGVK